LEQDKLLAFLPENHPLGGCELFPVSALCDYPFMLLEKGAKAGISEILKRSNLTPNIHFTTWDDYAIMSMVESDLESASCINLYLSVFPTVLLQKSWTR